MIFREIQGISRISHYKIPFFNLAIFFAALTVLGTQIVRFGLTPTKIILPWEFPLLIIIFFVLTGLFLGLYVLKNPKDFFFNILLFFLFTSSVGSLGWTVLDEFSLMFVALALLFTIKHDLIQKREKKDFVKFKFWIFLFLGLMTLQIISSMQGIFVWSEVKSIRFTLLFLSMFVLGYASIFLKLSLPSSEEMISKTIYFSAIYFFLTLLVGALVLASQLQGKTLFLMRGLGDASYGSAIFPALVTVPLSFFALLSNRFKQKLFPILGIVFPFLCAMLMDTRAGFLIFAVCLVMLPFVGGVKKTFQFLSVGMLASALVTTILVGEPLWFIDAFGSLFNINIEAGAVETEYYGETYSAGQGDIGRFMFAYCAAQAVIDNPFLFLAGVGNYGFYPILEPYLTSFKIAYHVPDYTFQQGSMGGKVRPPALGAWLVEQGIIGTILLLGTLISTVVSCLFVRKKKRLIIQDKGIFLILIPVFLIPIWGYFSEFQDNVFLYLLIMPFGFIHLITREFKFNDE